MKSNNPPIVINLRKASNGYTLYSEQATKISLKQAIHSNHTEHKNVSSNKHLQENSSESNDHK